MASVLSAVNCHTPTSQQLLYSVDMSTYLQLDTQPFDPVSAYTAAAAAAAAAAAGYNQRRSS